MTKLNAAEIKNSLKSVPDWTKRGSNISRTWVFKNFVAAMKFVNAAARLAERSQHHPDIDVRWNRVTLALSTHDAGGLTEKDFALAQELDRL
jgi:4a-hydroxytetrahydrobiopterin dehydratase